MVLNVNHHFRGESKHPLSSSERKLLTSYPVDSPLFNGEGDTYVLKSLYKAHIQDSPS